MKKNEIIPYNPKFKILARELRNNSTKSEIILWNKIKKNIPPTPFKGGGEKRKPSKGEEAESQPPLKLRQQADG